MSLDRIRLPTGETLSPGSPARPRTGTAGTGTFTGLDGELGVRGHDYDDVQHGLPEAGRMPR